jgi:hypothetical protein
MVSCIYCFVDIPVDDIDAMSDVQAQCRDSSTQNRPNTLSLPLPINRVDTGLQASYIIGISTVLPCARNTSDESGCTMKYAI